MRPRIICHIMGSVDGRLIDGRWSQPYEGTHADLLGVYAAIGRELDCGAWMLGKNTLRALFPYKFGRAGHAAKAGETACFIGKHSSSRYFVTIDPECDMYFTSPTVRGDDIIVVVGLNATIEYLGHLRRMNISYVMIEDVSDLGAAFEAIGATFGIRRISVQGGGILNGAILAAGLFDEVSLVVYPGLDGLSGVPSIFEYVNGATDSPAGGQRLQLIDVSRRDYGAVWLRYVVHKG